MRLRVGSAAAVSAAVLLVAAGCGSDGEAPGRDNPLAGTGAGADCVIDDPVKVGLVLSLTGGAAFIGGYQQQGLELAFDELNAKRGVRYEFVLEDDETSPERGVAHYAKLIDTEKVSVIAGPTLSTVGFAAFPDAEEAGVPAIGMSTTAEGIPDLGDYIFRDSLSERVALNASIPAAVAALDLKRVAILYDGDDEFTSSAYRTMKEALEGLGIEIVGEEEFGTADRTFADQLNRVKAAEPDAVVVSALLAATVPLIKEARELGIVVPIIGGNAFNSPVMVDDLGPAAEGLIVGGAWNAQLRSEGNEQFVAAFTQRYGRAPDQFAAQAYTAAQLIDIAVRTDCDGSREAIKDNLGQILEQETILGTLSIDENGEVYQDPVVQIVRDGVLVPLES